ncbi:hypothetical protein BD769DRAFT_916126 [Suillus cothurnatus]|nr:hypothetical protein BD769DRAFT_916126 [Suillus cothurnatus]
MRKSPLGSLRLCYLPTVMITVESRGLSSVSLALFRSIQAIANEIAHLLECSPRLVNSFGTVCRTCCTVVRECTKDSCGSLHRLDEPSVQSPAIKGSLVRNSIFNVEKLDNRSFRLSLKIRCSGLRPVLCPSSYMIDGCYKQRAALPPHSICFFLFVFELDAVNISGYMRAVQLANNITTPGRSYCFQRKSWMKTLATLHCESRQYAVLQSCLAASLLHLTT